MVDFTSSFPEMYSKVQGLWEYISGKLQVLTLQLLCNTSKANSLDADTSVTTVSLYMHAGKIQLYQ